VALAALRGHEIEALAEKVRQSRPGHRVSEGRGTGRHGESGRVPFRAGETVNLPFPLAAADRGGPDPKVPR